MEITAFHNKTSVKTKYLKRVQAHQKADEIIKGTYWEGGKGCAVGCTIESADHDRYETELGIPKEVAYLEDAIFEKLENGDAKKFPAQFLKAVKVGSDLSKVIAQIVIWQFEDSKWGLKNIKEVQDDKEAYGWCEEVVALYRRSLTETVTQKEYLELYEKIDARAWAGAWAWAWAGARAGAGAGARAWARAGARAGAGAGARAWARAWAGKKECTLALRDKFLQLLADAPLTP